MAGDTGGGMNPANLLTKRHWIVELARRKPGEVLFSLHHVIDFEWMREAYWLTRKDGATGIDGVTATEYEANLEANLLGPPGAHQVRPLSRAAGTPHLHPQGGRLAAAARHSDLRRQGGAAGDRYGSGGCL